MNSHTIVAAHNDFIAQRPPTAEEDVHMIANVTEYAILNFSKTGDLVFDPFAGFGTTLIHAQRLGRRALGIELLPERVDPLSASKQDTTKQGTTNQSTVDQSTVKLREANTASQTVKAEQEYTQSHSHLKAEVYEGDARELLRVLRLHNPKVLETGVDLILTSPPYMTRNDHPADPLTAYEKDDGDYARYLTELNLVAAQCARLVKPSGYVIWNVADIEHDSVVTPLIAESSKILQQHLTHVTTVEIVWDRYPHDLIRDALLVFRID